MQHTLNKLNALNNTIVSGLAGTILTAASRKRSNGFTPETRRKLRKALIAAAPLLVTYPNHDTLNELADILEGFGLKRYETKAVFAYYGYDLPPPPPQKTLFSTLNG